MRPNWKDYNDVLIVNPVFTTQLYTLGKTKSEDLPPRDLRDFGDNYVLLTESLESKSIIIIPVTDCVTAGRGETGEKKGGVELERSRRKVKL